MRRYLGILFFVTCFAEEPAKPLEALNFSTEPLIPSILENQADVTTLATPIAATQVEAPIPVVAPVMVSPQTTTTLLTPALTFPAETAIDFQPPSSSIWSQSKVFHFASNEDLADVIRDFCTLEDMDVVLSQKISGKVNKHYKDLMPIDFWTELTQAYSLIWFYDGTILYVYNGSETQSKVLKLPPAKIGPLIDIVTHFNFASSKISMKAVQAAGIVFISGPPKFIETVESIADKMIAVVPEETGKMIVQVFPLKYAWAADSAYGNVQIPGVASQLRSLLSGSGGSNFTLSSSNLDTSHRVQAMQGGLAQKEKALEQANVPQEKKTGMHVDLSGNITIDPRINALIIKDYESNMPLYQNVIDILDKPVRMVEITAAIVDIDKDNGSQIGTDSTKIENLRHLNPLTITPTSSDTSSTASTIAGKFTSIVNSADFTFNLTALENDGVAHVMSRPSVATLDNIEASINTGTTEYVQVKNSDVSDLYPISAQTLLRVTPHIIENGMNRKIKLMLTVQNAGTSASTLSTGQPKVTDTSIVTQAIVDESQSLLLGGYFKEDFSDIESGIPFLRRIPILGLLFKKTVKSRTVQERLFLITPRIIEIAYGNDKYKDYMTNDRAHGESILKKVEASPLVNFKDN
ncbi:MAG: hypothetical protein A2Y14_04025 [Verrucomicrobia bacterium GWF2_51_19]|nr:MAG: hypothetical protein A2Y14_04025 [Verrucomicrobia bacterium GWF2_51_19]HCJ11671.1 hypothetical protein [Opitutae bacterium]